MPAAQLAKAEKTKALRVRVLELKDNPAARHEAVKQTMLTALKKENAALLAQVERRAQEKNRPLVPYASPAIEVLRAEMRELNDTLAEKTERYGAPQAGICAQVAGVSRDHLRATRVPCRPAA